MKNYNVVASKEIVAKFTMDYSMYEMKFEYASACVEWIRSEHPELENSPWDYECYRNNTIVFRFYSLGNLVIEEV